MSVVLCNVVEIVLVAVVVVVVVVVGVVVVAVVVVVGVVGVAGVVVVEVVEVEAEVEVEERSGTVVAVAVAAVCLSIYLSIYLPIYLSSCNFENAAIWRDFLNFWTWQRQKRNNSARLPQFLNLTTSKMKQFCETSSIFEVDNIKNDTILRDFLQKWKVECGAEWSWRLRTNAFCDLSTPPV